MWIILFLLIFFATSLTYAEDEFLLTGKVISLDKEKGIIVLAVKKKCCKKNTCQMDKQGRHVVSILIEDEGIMKKMEIGRMFRFWLSPSEDKKELIAKTVSSPGRCLGGIDKTGIRKRLRKSGSMGGGFGKRHGR